MVSASSEARAAASRWLEICARSSSRAATSVVEAKRFSRLSTTSPCSGFELLSHLGCLELEGLVRLLRLGLGQGLLILGKLRGVDTASTSVHVTLVLLVTLTDLSSLSMEFLPLSHGRLIFLLLHLFPLFSLLHPLKELLVDLVFPDLLVLLQVGGLLVDRQLVSSYREVLLLPQVAQILPQRQNALYKILFKLGNL